MRLNALFCDHMVLQADRPIRIFGEGCGIVRVRIDGLTAEKECSTNLWTVQLDAHPYGGPYDLSVELNGERRTIRDVYFGDILLIAGQSNLQLKLFETNTPQALYESNPMLRLFTLRRPEEGESFFPEDGWLPAQAETVGKWTGIGYLAGNMLSKQSGHAVGLIACYQGASMIQSWLPAGILEGTECDLASEPRSGMLREPQYLAWNHDGLLYREMFRKIVPLSVKAVIWYQGESNSNPPDNTVAIYSGMLKRLLSSWRADLEDPALPFLIIQLPNLKGANVAGWQAVQEAQSAVCDADDRAVCIPCADICEDNHIHPPTKLPLAERIAEQLYRL